MSWQKQETSPNPDGPEHLCTNVDDATHRKSIRGNSRYGVNLWNPTDLFFGALLWLLLTICFITSNTENLWNWNLIASWLGAIVDNWMVTASTWREIPSRRRPSQSRFLLWFRPHPNKVTQQKMLSLCLSGFRIGLWAAFKSHTMVSQLRKEYHWAMFDLCIRGSTSYYRNGVIICTSSTNLTNHDGLIGSMLKMLLHKNRWSTRKEEQKLVQKKKSCQTGHLSFYLV